MDIYCFKGDDGATSTDPEQVKLNFRIPVKCLLDASATAGNEEIVISRQFLNAFSGGDKMVKCLENNGVATMVEPMKRSRLWSAPLIVESYNILDKSPKPDPKPKVKDKVVVEHTVIARFKKCLVMLDDLKTLKRGSLIHGNVFDYGLARSLDSCNFAEMGGVCTAIADWNLFWSKSSVTPTLVETHFKELSKDALDKNLLKIKFLFIPILYESHFALVVVCNPFPSEEQVLSVTKKETSLLRMYFKWGMDSRRPAKIFILDSLLQRLRVKGIFNIHDKHVKRIRSRLFDLHKRYWKDKNCEFVLTEELFHGFLADLEFEAPGQENAFDGGLHCMRYAVMWLTELKKAELDYLSLPSIDNPYQRYSKFVTRRILFRMLYEDAKNDGYSHAVKQLYKELF